MKKEKQALSPATHVGFISLLMIALVVCLAIFISLTLRSVNADFALTDRTGTTVADRTIAHNRYQKFLGELDALLFDMETANEANLQECLGPLLSEDITYDESTQIITANWASGERLLLHVRILIHTSGNGARYSVLSVETVAIPQD